MEREVLAQDRCRPIRLASPLKQGGDGDVFAVGPDEMAKIFKDPKQYSYGERAKAFRDRSPRDIPIATGPRAGLRRFAPPRELLLDPASREIVGYLMWRVPEAAELIHFIDPSGPHFIAAIDDRLALLRAILESLEILEQHPLQVVFDDINLANVLVHVPTHHPTLIDFDGHQVTVGGKVLVTPMHRPEFLPPELHARPGLLQAARSRTHHNFAVAVLCSYFLLEGRHPFQAVPAASDLGRRIQEGRYPYLASTLDAPPPGMAEHYRRRLAPHVRHLMERAFVGGHADASARPSVSEWRVGIEAELDRPYRTTFAGRMAALRARPAQPGANRPQPAAAPAPAAPGAQPRPQPQPQPHGGHRPRTRRPHLVKRALRYAAALLILAAGGRMASQLSVGIRAPRMPRAAFEDARWARTSPRPLAAVPRPARPADPREIEELRTLARPRPAAAGRVVDGDPGEIEALRAMTRADGSRPRRSPGPTGGHGEPSEIEQLRVEIRREQTRLMAASPPPIPLQVPVAPVPRDPTTSPPEDGGGFLSWLDATANELAGRIERSIGIEE
jgi:hypothetical protein